MSLQIFFLLLFSVIVSFSSLLTKIALKRKKDPIAYTAIHSLAGGILIIPLVIFDHRLPTGFSPWLFLLLGTATSLAGDYFYFKSFALEDISVLTLVFRLRTVLVFLFGALAYGEAITLNKIVVMLVVTLGTLVTSYQKQKLTFSKGIIYISISCVFLAAMTIVDKKVSSEVSVPLYNTINFLTSGIFFLLLSTKGNLRKILTIKDDVFLLPTIGGGLLLSLASICRRYALTLGEISYAAPFLNVSLVFTMLLGIFVLKETKQLPQKIAGMMLILFGLLIQK